MTLSVFLAVLMAAALHAGWNALVKIKLDPFVAMTLICAACSVIAIPAVAITGLPIVATWPWVAASVAIHFAYYVSLSEAYRRADMSQVYPIARGAAPLITTVLSLFLVHDGLHLGNVVGVVVLACGVVLVSFRGHRRGSGSSRAAAGWALMTAAAIAAYTVVDGLGARVAGNANQYAASLFLLDAIPMLIFCYWRKGIDGTRPAFRFLVPGFAGGAMSLVAYWIVIWAMSVAPIALVAALRETSVLFGGLIAVVFLKEPFTRVRAASAGLTVLGLLLMRLL